MDPTQADQPGSRIERDSMGEVAVPSGALWGAQTQRALQNFPASGLRMPLRIIHAMASIKAAAAAANAEAGDLPGERAAAIRAAAGRIVDGSLDGQFPLDLFQTGSGTSTNMNLNEVIATLASRECGAAVSANDDVNMSQSSNDVMPTAIHLAAALLLERELLPAVAHLSQALAVREQEFAATPKTGRTHLMDAVPITLGQEISGWRAQVDAAAVRFAECGVRLRRLAQGGTAVGTGLNARPGFAEQFARRLGEHTGLAFTPAPNAFAALAAQDTAVELSGQLKVLAVSLTKICNDLRWMNSGPLAGLGEIRLPELQPGSSIMPGKVNPVVPESVAMMAAQIIGNDAALTLGGLSGNFELNVMLPLIAHNLLESLELATLGCRTLADRAIAGFSADAARMAGQLARNPILVTALNPLIGYERGAAIAKQAYREGLPILEVAVRMTTIPREQLAAILDPLQLTGGGVHGKAGPG
ncbi:MAG: class II fumarate hydratase [Steroidobacteraceae bacterium]